MNRRRRAVAVVLATTVGCGRIAFDPLGDGGTDPDGGTVVSACTSVTSSAPVRLATVDPAERIDAVATSSGIVVGWGSATTLHSGEVAPTGGPLRVGPTTVSGTGYNIVLAASPTGVGMSWQSQSSGPSTVSFRQLSLVGEPTGGSSMLITNAQAYGNDIAWDGSSWLVSWAQNSGAFGAFTNRVAPSASILETNQKVSNQGDCVCEPAVASNGTIDAVVFSNDGLPGGGGTFDVGFNTYDAAGTVVHANAIAVTTNGGLNPEIAATSDGFAIAYGQQGTAEMVWVDALGNVVGGPVVVSPDAFNYRLTTTPAGTFVLYEYQNVTTGTSYAVGWLDRSGTYVRGPFDVVSEPDMNRKAVAVPRDDGVVVFYTSGIDATQALWTRTFTCVD